MKGERRDLLRWLGRALAGLLLGGGAVLAGRFAQRPRARDLSRRVLVGEAGSIPLGATVYLASHNIHVLRGTLGIYALSGSCTHLGCSLKLEPDGFTCPCHGARFDRQGRPVSGPAPRPLVGYRVFIGLGRAWVNLDDTVPAGTATRA